MGRVNKRCELLICTRRLPEMEALLISDGIMLRVVAAAQRMGRPSAAERTILPIQGEGIAKCFADGYNEKDYIR